MQPLKNPFKPTAGAEPPRLIGREDVIMHFEDGLNGGVGSPSRLMRITGPRGSGKTALLTEFGERARRLDWNTVDVTASPDILEEIQDELETLSFLKGGSVEVSLPFVSASGEVGPRARNLRQALSKASERKSGLLVTIDEVQAADRSDMEKLAAAVQHIIREKGNIALVFAGLTSGVMDLINGKAMTFLRRAQAEDLASLGNKAVAVSLRQTFEETGLDLRGEALERAADAAKGYPYLIQLVGFYVWEQANRHRSQSPKVALADIEDGCSIAFERFHQAVHEPAISALTKNGVEYLLAMAQDKGASQTTEVARRIGKSSGAASSIRSTLIQKQVIEQTAKGYVGFAIPYLGDYLREYEAEVLARFGGR